MPIPPPTLSASTGPGTMWRKIQAVLGDGRMSRRPTETRARLRSRCSVGTGSKGKPAISTRGGLRGIVHMHGTEPRSTGNSRPTRCLNASRRWETLLMPTEIALLQSFDLDDTILVRTPQTRQG